MPAPGAPAAHTSSELDGQSQDAPKRLPTNPHLLQAHVTSWLANNNALAFPHFQMLYNALLDDEPEGFADLIDDQH
jgi:hypothetical protein